MVGKEKLLEVLVRSPGDWGARLALMEIAVRQGDLGEAKRLVRASPSDVPTPPEVQVRIHALLTGEVSAIHSPVEDLRPGREERGIDEVPHSPTKESSTPAICFEEESTVEKSAPRSERPPVTGETSPVLKSEIGGGLSALIESEVAIPVSKKPTVGTRGKSPKLEKAAAKEKWANYDGEFELASVDLVHRSERPSETTERFSALSLALMAHVAVFLLVSLVVVQVPRPKPPQLVVSISQEKEAEIVTTLLTRPSLEIKPTAAAPSALDVVSTIAMSSFSIQDTENSGDLLASSLYAGDQPMGLGMSFSTDTDRSSDVNFFGISGSGRKIVFIIDASPKMLVDEKGGMDAYDNVKEEVGIMLAGLNRGTLFNLLLYDGKRLVGFRDELVPGLPSNLRQAIDWLDPMNRDYGALGLRPQFSSSLPVSDYEGFPIHSRDLAHYSKAVQKAMEWQASAIFCIFSGYESMGRSPTPEMLEKMKGRTPRPSNADAGESREERAWREAVAKTRAWLEKENAARSERGVSLKVVTNFNQLVREVTGATPPRREGSSGNNPLRMPPVTQEDIEQQVLRLVRREYKGEGLEAPSLHMVLFLGEGEKLEDDEGHFRRLTGKNRGKLKVLRGLAGLKNVTAAN